MKFLLLLFIFLGGCGLAVSDERAVDAMESLGFTNVVIKESHWMAPSFFGCGDDDDVAFETTGIRDGRSVNVTVCCGWALKGCTTRF